MPSHNPSTPRDLATELGIGLALESQRDLRVNPEPKVGTQVIKFDSLDRYDSNASALERKARLEDFFKELVKQRANGNANRLTIIGVDGKEGAKLKFANSAGLEIGIFKTILRAYAFACYEADGFDPEKTGVSISNIHKHNGYNLAKHIVRIKNDAFKIEAAAEFRFISLSRYNPKAPAIERKAALSDFFKELVNRRANGDASKLTGYGVDGRKGRNLRFRNIEGQEIWTFPTILYSYAFACFEVDGHDPKSSGVGTANIFKQPTYSKPSLLTRYHESQANLAIVNALDNEDLRSICAHIKGDTPRSLCVFAEAVFRPDRRWGIPLGKDDGRELWIQLPENYSFTTYPPKALLIPEQLGTQAVIRVNLEQNQIIIVDFADLVANRPTKPALEKIRVAISHEIDKLSRDLTPEVIRDLSVRYLLPFGESVWRAMGWKYQGLLQSDVGERLVREKLLEVATPTYERRATQSFDPLESSLEVGRQIERPRVAISADSIRRLAQALTPAEAQLAQDHMRDIQAQAFLEHLVTDLADELSYRGASLDQVSLHLERYRVAELNPILHRAYEGTINRIKEYQAIVERVERAGCESQLRVNQLKFIAAATAENCTSYYNGDSMGGGKTRAALATVLLLNQPEALVVCPSTACPRWLEEIGQMFAPGSNALELVVLADEQIPKHIKENQKIEATVHSTIEAGQAWIASRKTPKPGTLRLIISNNIRVAQVFENAAAPKVVIVDEAHTIKNIETATAAWICAERKAGAIERIYLLSGTPVENGPEDLYVPLKLLYAGTSSPMAELTLRQYMQMFAEYDVGGLSTLHGNLKARFSRTDVRRLLPDLPQVRKDFIMLDLELGTMRLGDAVVALSSDYTRQAKLYREALLDIGTFERERVRRDGPELADAAATPSTRPKRLNQILLNPELFDSAQPEPASIKRDALIALARLDGDTLPSLIASDYVAAIGKTRTVLAEGGVKTALIDGSIRNSATETARTDQIRAFQSGQADALLVTTGTMAFSEQLTRAQKLVWLNLPDRSTVEDQMLGRIVRPDPMHNPPGKIVTEQVLCLEGPDSIDIAYDRLLAHKRLFHEMLVLGNLSPEIAAQFAKDTMFLSEALRRDGAEVTEYSEGHPLIRSWRLVLGNLKRDTRNALTATQIASAWDAVGELYFASVATTVQVPLSEALLDVMLDSYWHEGAKIRFLDAGAGTGCVAQARERMNSRFTNAHVSLNITNYDVSATMQHYDTSSETRLCGEFSELGTKFEAASFEHVHFGHSFWYARDPVKLLEDSHRLLDQNGLLTIVLPSAYQFCPQFEGALERLGYFVDSGAESKLKALIDHRTYKRIVERYGTAAAEDARDIVVAGSRILIARKLGEREGERPLAEELMITKAAPKVSATTVQSLLQAPAWRDVIGPISDVSGELIQDNSYSADELSNQTICTSAVARQLRISFQLLSRIPNSGPAPDLSRAGLHQHVTLIDLQLSELSNILLLKRCELNYEALRPLVAKIAGLMCLQSPAFVSTAHSPELSNLKIRTLALLGSCVP